MELLRIFKKYRDLEERVERLEEKLNKDNNVRLLRNKDVTLKRYKRIIEELRRNNDNWYLLFNKQPRQLLDNFL